MNFFQFLVNTELANQIAIIDWKRNSFSYGDIERFVNKMANALSMLGACKNDRIAVRIEKSPHNIILYLACLKAGLIYVPLNNSYTSFELQYFFLDAKPTLIICDPSQEASIKEVSNTEATIFTMDSGGYGSFLPIYDQAEPNFEIVPTDDNDTAVIIYTSGTTGKPKGAMISHRALYVNGRGLTDFWGFTAEDVLLHALPLFHVHGLFFALSTVFLSGSKMILLPKFDLTMISSFAKESTVFMGVPTYYTRLLNSETLNDFSPKIRLYISGSAPLLEATFQEFYCRTGHSILERYGMSEAGIISSNPLCGTRKKGTVGKPLPGVDVCIVDEDNQLVKSGDVGHIQIKGENLFCGYWNMPEKTKEEFTIDGYFKTGDMGFFDEEGYLSIVGRSKDLIITGGLNVYPKEIEMTIDSFPGVLESAVVGIPDPDFGEGIIAVVCTSKKIESRELAQYLKRYHTGYKLPKEIIFVNELPKNTMGKVMKQELRKKYAAQFSNPLCTQISVHYRVEE